MKRKIVNIVLMAAMLLNLFGTLTAFADDVAYFEENFDSADWKSDWTSNSESAADTYDATNGMVTLAEQAMFPNGVSGKKLKASLTVDTAAGVDGGNYGLYVRFENVEDSSDKVSIAVSGYDDVVYVYTDAQSGWQATTVTLSAVESDRQLKLSTWDKNNYYTQTYVFELTGDSLLITEMNQDRKDGSTASTNKKRMYLPNFNTYFTSGASYKVGLAQYGTGTVKIDKFTVVPPFDIEVPADEIDIFPGAGVLINTGKMPLLNEPTSDNIYLVDENEETVATVIEKISSTQYKLKLAEDTWLDSGATYKVVVTGLMDTLNQSHTPAEKELTAKSYQNDFIIGDISRFTEDSVKEAITSPEAGTYQISAKLFATNQSAQTADIAVMVCEGTEALYRVKEIHYYNDVAAFAEVTPTINVSEGEFLKIMSVDDFTTGKSVTNPVILK